MSQGDLTNALTSLSPNQRSSRERQIANSSEREVADSMIRDMQNTRNFHILDKHVVSDDEVFLQLVVEGERTPETTLVQRARMIKDQSGWKFDGWVNPPSPPPPAASSKGP